jgi:hypothetical protein
MKNLAKIIGLGFFGLVGLNLNAQYKSFLKEDYNKYSMSYALADINGDSIHDVIVVDYDLNMNGKKDVRGVFIITEKKEEMGNNLVYSTRNKACMLIIDNNEDGKDDEILMDKDLDGNLDFYMGLKDVKKPKPVIL